MAPKAAQTGRSASWLGVATVRRDVRLGDEGAEAVAQDVRADAASQPCPDARGRCDQEGSAGDRQRWLLARGERSVSALRQAAANAIDERRERAWSADEPSARRVDGGARSE